MTICNLQYYFHISGRFHQAQSHVDSVKQINKISVMYTLRKMVSSVQAILLSDAPAHATMRYAQAYMYWFLEILQFCKAGC